MHKSLWSATIQIISFTYNIISIDRIWTVYISCCQVGQTLWLDLPSNTQYTQFAFWLLKYYYSYQVNEIICIEALHKDLCIKFGYITKMAYCDTTLALYRRNHMLQEWNVSHLFSFFVPGSPELVLTFINLSARNLDKEKIQNYFVQQQHTIQ